MNQAKRKKVKAYHRLKIFLFFLHFLITAAFLFLFVLTGMAHTLRNVVSEKVSPSWFLPLAYATLLASLTYLLEFPMSLIGGYLLEKRYGLSTQTLAGWCAREFKKASLSLFFFLILVGTGYALIARMGEHWWVAFGALWFIYHWLLAQIFPVFIVPLFFRYTAVQDEALVHLLKEFAVSQGRDVDSVKVIDLSKETKKANAAVLGIGKKKRIVLGDTLVRHFTHEEIKVVFAHELGHDKEKHLVASLFFNALVTFSGIYCIQKILLWSFPFFRLSSIGDPAALPLFLFLFSMYGFLLMPVQNGFSRILEHRADVFALRTTGLKNVFVSAMQKLLEQNLADESPSRLVEIFFYSHPPISKRIAFAETF